ncbi:MAG TPA: ABC transporter permease [Stellaceae bacterium]|nr:ABC transporter permease [Stellaceae bacterium]
MRPLRLLWWLASVAVAAGFVGLWQVAADSKWLSPVFFAGPGQAWDRLVAGLVHGTLGIELADTVGRMIYGWAAASLLGIALGSLIGISPRARAYLAPMIEFVRPVPASALVPVAIGFLGLSDEMVLAVVVFGGLWPMLLATIHGFETIEPRLTDVSRALGFSRLQVILKIALPSALPDIFAALRLSVTVSLVLTIIGEMLASRDGLGQWILFAGRTFRPGDLFAGIILLGGVGFVSASLIAWLEQRLLNWRRPP